MNKCVEKQSVIEKMIKLVLSVGIVILLECLDGRASMWFYIIMRL